MLTLASTSPSLVVFILTSVRFVNAHVIVCVTVPVTDAAIYCCHLSTHDGLTSPPRTVFLPCVIGRPLHRMSVEETAC